MWSGVFHQPTWLGKLALLGFLCILAVTLTFCYAGASMLRRHVIQHDAAVVSDLVAGLVTRALPASYFDGPAGVTGEGLAGVAVGHDVVRLVLYDRHGVVLWSDEGTLRGQRVSESFELAAALGGDVTADVFRPGREPHHATLRRYAQLEEIYIPLRYQAGGPVVGVLEVYRHPPALFTLLDRGLTLVWTLGGSGGLVLYVMLFGVIRQAARRERRRRDDEMIHGERLVATGLMAAGAAHEIGNALTCVSSLCQMLSALATDPRTRQGLADVQRHADRIDRVLGDLRRLARPRPFELGETALGDLIDTAIRLARHNPASRDMRIATTLAPSLPAVRSSADHLVQVFINLILNAAESGGDLAITANADHGGVRIEFRDTGCGMPAEQLARLFEPFASTKDRGGHLGLGLYVCREVVHRHGGRIGVESRPGEGSAVTVLLPAERP